jgi:hypothetical protein
VGDFVVLFRPVGQKEFDRIEETGFKRFPPRFPEQPVFYPVTNENYASQIARNWNARFNEDKVGFVARFSVRKEYLDAFEKHIVGGSEHEEYWIPSEQLEEFNDNIVGSIEIIAEFRNAE